MAESRFSSILRLSMFICAVGAGYAFYIMPSARSFSCHFHAEART